MQFNNLDPNVMKLKLGNGLPRWLNFLNDIPIRIRLILVFLTLSIIPIVLMGVISYTVSKNAISNKMLVYSFKELSQTNKNLNLVLQKYQDFTVQLGTTEEFSQILDSLNQPGSFEVHMNGVQKLQNAFQAAFSLEKTFLGMAYYPAANSELIVNAGLDDDNTVKSFQKTNQYRSIIKDKSRTWVFYNQKFFLVSPVYNTFNGSFLGVCFIFLKQDGLDKLINFTIYNDADFSEEKLGSTPYMMGITRKGEIFISPYAEDLGSTLPSIVNDPRIIEAITASQSERKKFSKKIRGRRVMLTCNALSEGDFYLLEIAPYSFLYDETAIMGWSALFLGILIALTVIVISLSFASSVSQPLMGVMQVMKQAEDGVLSGRVTINSRDELGHLGNSFNMMLSRIKNIVTQTKAVVAEVSEHSQLLEINSRQSARTAEAISVVTQEISKGTAEQTVEAEKAARKMGELAKQIETVVAKSHEMEEISSAAKHQSQTSKEAADRLMDKAIETDAITKAFANDICELNASVAEIRNITEMISYIAEQTNLLALNAAIEAARAGQYGLGFAVVAEEVNKLAVKSQNAAQMIDSNINQILERTRISTQTAERAHDIVEEQLHAMQQARQSYEAIIEAMNTIVARNSDVHESIQKMNNVKEETLISISSISTVSEETAASSEEVTASAQEQAVIAEQVSKLANELLKMADKLVTSISVFKD
ncbi:MAG TPA: methyl-accepting chemotaxis protein [Bacillota bacterium]|nr:methyl-accepting chemotaxis protein [Bacillota bacterium]